MLTSRLVVIIVVVVCLGRHGLQGNAWSHPKRRKRRRESVKTSTSKRNFLESRNLKNERKKEKQGRIHGNLCGGWLGRGSNVLGRGSNDQNCCLTFLKYLNLHLLTFQKLNKAKKAKWDRPTLWFIGRVTHDKNNSETKTQANRGPLSSAKYPA